ncbi:MAG: lysylphosphatidylglycerol synthase transmembrane domain-containing protein [Candidatus Woesearchaeota archaeon]
MNIEKKHLMIFTAILGVLLFWYVFTKVPLREVLNTISNATWQLIALYLASVILIQLVLTYRWKIILESQGIKHSFWKLNNYRMAGVSVGFLTPSASLGGEPVRAGLLSKEADLSFEKALSSVVIDKTIELSSSAVFFIIGSIILLLAFVVSPKLEIALIIISLIFLLLVISFNYRMFQGKKFFHPIIKFVGLLKVKRIKKIENKILDFEKLVLKFFKKDKKHFVYVVLFSLLSWIIMFVEYSVLARIVGQNLEAIQIFLAFSFVGGAYILPIPMGIGALEAGQVSLFSIIQISAAAGLALALIVRLKDTLLSAIGVLIFFKYGLNFNALKNARVSDKERKEVIKKL